MTFQMIYVLKGWVKFWYEREGELMLKAGDFVYHPPRAAHDLLEYRTDCAQMAPPLIPTYAAFSQPPGFVHCANEFSKPVGVRIVLFLHG